MQSNHPAPRGLDTPSADLADAIKRGYEPKDISLRGLFIFLGTLVLSLVVVLAAIYGILMALVDYDRSKDPLGTPVSITRPEQYAPLQPSVGHNTLDTDDMTAMREQNYEVLNNPKLARQMPIAQAMDVVLPMLVTKPAVSPRTSPPGYVAPPPGAIEGSPIGVNPEAKVQSLKVESTPE